MDINQKKEQFSNAYFRAVAAVAGFTCYKPEPDTDSVDWGITAVGGKGSTRSPTIEVQLKCTSRNLFNNGYISYPLKIKNYNELRVDNYQAPRILIVVVVPDDENNWLTQSEEELAMRHCGYWLSLLGMRETDNDETVTVRIPREQQFTVDALQQIMNRIGGGGLP